MSIRVVKVNMLRTLDQRSTVCYVGRTFAGWPGHQLGNPFRPRPNFDAVAAYRSWLLGRPVEVVERAFADLWEDCEHGTKPLGCWCVNATHGDGQPVICHGQVLAEELAKRFLEPTK